ncbi:hypothetical protein BJ742DRAFT_565204 [Cladochytrium replicatum]|nr:hypothetical protein BJ742DRAFT_565204 [Cladochytrium replicatum]
MAVVVFPDFVSSITVGASFLAAWALVVQIVVSLVAATLAITFIDQPRSYSFITAISNLVHASYIHKFLSRPGLFDLFASRTEGKLAELGKQPADLETHPTAAPQISRIPPSWVLLITLCPVVLLFSGLVAPLGVHECDQFYLTPFNLNQTSTFEVSDPTLLGASTDLNTDVDNVTLYRVCGALAYKRCPGMEGIVRMRPDYRDLWIGANSQNGTNARGVGDFTFRLFGQSSEPVGGGQREYFLAGNAAFVDILHLNYTEEAIYSGRMIIDWKNGGVSPVKMITPHSDGDIKVRSIWARPEASCMKSGLRMRIFPNTNYTLSSDEASYWIENVDAFQNLPSEYPYDPDGIPPLSWILWKYWVVTIAGLRKGLIEGAKQPNSTYSYLAPPTDRNYTSAQAAALWPKQFNVTARKGYYDKKVFTQFFPESTFNITDLSIGVICAGIGGADIFNSSRRVPFTGCWYKVLAPAPDTEPGNNGTLLREIVLCGGRVNYTVEDTIFQIRSRAVTRVTPLRQPLPATWALERPNVTVADTFPLWKLGSCPPSDGTDDTACDQVPGPTLPHPAGASALLSGLLVDGLASNLGQGAWNMVFDSFTFPIDGATDARVRQEWLSVAKVLQASNASDSQWSELLEQRMRVWWTDGAANVFTGPRPPLELIDVSRREARFCVDPLYLVQIWVCIFLVATLLVVRISTADSSAWTWARKWLEVSERLDLGSALVKTVENEDRRLGGSILLSAKINQRDSSMQNSAGNIHLVVRDKSDVLNPVTSTEGQEQIHEPASDEASERLLKLRKVRFALGARPLPVPMSATANPVDHSHGSPAAMDETTGVGVAARFHVAFYPTFRERRTTMADLAELDPKVCI